MESNTSLGSIEQGSPEQLPSLFKYIASKAVAGFDTIPSPRANPTFNNGPEVTNSNTQASDISMLSSSIPIETIESPLRSSVSISMPASPSNLYVDQTKHILVNENPVSNGIVGHSDHSLSNNASGAPAQQKQSLFYSQPIQASTTKTTTQGKGLATPQSALRNNRLKDKSFDSFKTWSGKLERQISNLRGIPQDPEDISNSEITQHEAFPGVQRYFDALEGPELETLKSSEELVLPKDKKWPFLLRFPISAFGMCLGVSSQAILWKTLATSPSMSFLHVSLTVNIILWCISLVLISVVACTYSIKIIFYFEAVRREYYHPVRVNFFFAPWIACLFLALGVPPSVAVNLHASLWYVLMTPILCLELKIYGQWMSGGQRRLSKVANPTNHLSIVGNFVGALLGASMGLKEGPIFFFAVGLAHYSVLFVTLYQRLPTNETLPKELHPVFFLFVAAPSVASMAWARISGDFSYGSRIVYFIALFLYISLAVRINFFRGFRFSLAWWAYTFPMTGASIATIRYSAVVNNWLTESLSVALSAIATITVCGLLLSTILHAFVFHDLFPNDISIAISEKRTKPSKKHTYRRRTTSSDDKDVEACLSV